VLLATEILLRDIMTPHRAITPQTRESEPIPRVTEIPIRPLIPAILTILHRIIADDSPDGSDRTK
jgi:hypothetical protein